MSDKLKRTAELLIKASNKVIKKKALEIAVKLVEIQDDKVESIKYIEFRAKDKKRVDNIRKYVDSLVEKNYSESEV